jgi:hypothetical protein
MIQNNIHFIKAASPRGELGQIITHLKLYSILKFNNIHRPNVYVPCAQLKYRLYIKFVVALKRVFHKWAKYYKSETVGIEANETLCNWNLLCSFVVFNGFIW